MHDEGLRYDETIMRGRITSIDAPDWDPLEKFLPLALCPGFMWMHATALDNGTELQAYKHSLTRRYLLLDDDGDTYEYLDRGRYRRMRHSDAIEQVFTTSWVLDHAEPDERAAVKRALADAWERGNGDVAAGAHIHPSSPACALRRLP
jgi:hypothetical protein